MSIQVVSHSAQEHLQDQGIDGWLIYDYRGMNPIFRELVGDIPNVTRPCWIWLPAIGQPVLLISYVDQGRFAHLDISTIRFVSRQDMTVALERMLGTAKTIAMEYSPTGELPRVSKVDAGTLELVRDLGVRVVSSADTLQYATQRWSEPQHRSHMEAASKLSSIVHHAFDYIGENLSKLVTEYDIAEFIRRRFVSEGLVVTDGPVVAVNEHASDPHFDPTPGSSDVIKNGDWILIDLWSRMAGDNTVFADITWMAYVGDDVPEPHRQVFDTVIGARDLALSELERAFDLGLPLHGWQLDEVARNYITEAGYGEHFNHRLGHSIGTEVHANAVNLDGWETYDTRPLIPGIGVTIEPGIYLPEFGVRSEIDVFISEEGPVVTTEVQRSIVKIGSKI